jgi:hypothetical protein
VQLRLHPRTLSHDGDPCDVLVLSPMPLITGVVVRCRPIGMLKMEDEAGSDSKVLAVPVDQLTGIYRSVQSPRDLPEVTTQQIAHFFEHYKDLEPGKWVRVSTWVGAEEAKTGDSGRDCALRRGEFEAEDLTARMSAAGPSQGANRPPSGGAHGDSRDARGGTLRPRRTRVRQLAFPFLFVLPLEHRLHRRQVRARVRASRSSFFSTGFVLVAALMGAVALAMRASWPSTLRNGDMSSSRGWLVMGLPRAVCSWRSRAACRRGWRPCSSGLQPILTVVLARGWLGERRGAAAMAGARTGLAGVWLVVRHKVVLTSDGKALAAISIALFGISVGTLYQKRYCSHIDLRSGAFIQFFGMRDRVRAARPRVRAIGAGAMDSGLRLRAGLAGRGAVGRRDQPPLLAVAAWRRVERGRPFLSRSRGDRRHGLVPVRREARCRRRRGHGC